MKLVIDAGGTFIKYALMNDDATIVEQSKIKTPEYKHDVVLETFKGLIDKYHNKIDGVAFSFPGVIDSDTGFLYSTGAFNCFNQENFFDLMKDYTDLPISIENDGKCAALAESWCGNLKDNDDGIVVILGTGIGGGIIKNKAVHRGKHFSAGEFSFTLTDSNNLSFGSAWALVNSVPGLVHNVEVALKLEENTLDGKALFKLIEEGNEVACEYFDVYTRRLMVQLYNLNCILDPEKILIGGGISKQPLLIEKLNEQFNKFSADLPFPLPMLHLDVCKFHNDSNLIGALRNYLIHHEK